MDNNLKLTLFGVDIVTENAKTFLSKHSQHKLDAGRNDKDSVLFIRCIKCNELFLMTFEEVRELRKEQELCQKST